MFGIGAPELIVILVIVLIVFGAGKLPEIGGAIGKSVKNFKKSVRESDENGTAQDNKKIDEKK
jgi:sec-independent protein translocase protein TatA